MTSLSAAGFGVTINGLAIVQDVNLEVSLGDWLCIVGPNGAGKSTLLKGLAGLIEHQGTLHLDENDLQQLSIKDRACWVAYVAQNPIMPSGMRVFDYVLLGRTAHLSFLAKESDRDLEITSLVIKELALEEFSEREVDTLSGGERQRVALARALAQASPIVLLDEPTSALDVGYQQEVLELIDRLRNEKKIAAITTMHDLTLSGLYPDQILLMKEGRVLVSGTPTEVFTTENIKNAYGADVNVIPGEVGPVVIPQRRSKS